MSLLQQLTLWSPKLGDIFFGSAQSGALGTSFGNGAATFGSNPQNPLQMGDDGNLNVQIVSAGRSPATTANDNVLAVFSIPANAFDIANRGIAIMAAGSVASNVNSKTLKIILNPTTAVVGSAVTGGTTVASLVTNTTAGAGGWELTANLFKYGAAGSNTQIAIHEAGQAGNVVSSLVAPSLTTFPENAPIVVAITGNAATTASDIVFNFLQIFAMN